MGLLRRHRLDPELGRLLVRSAAVVERSGAALAELIGAWPEARHLAKLLRELEHENDQLAHDVIHRLARAGRRAGIDFHDGQALAGALDDVVDFAEETADAFVLYAVEAPMEQAAQLAQVLGHATAEVRGAIEALAADTDPQTHLDEIHRLENEGDRLEREGLASLFAEGIDPMVVIRWKDLFSSLESAIDACQAVANAVAGVRLRR